MPQPNDTIVPNDSHLDVPSFDVLVNGSAINPGYQILSISVTNEVNTIPTAKIVMMDGTASEQTFPISESESFVPGNTIEIKLGHDQHNTSVFKGMVVRQSLRARESGDPYLTVDCRDEAFKLTLGRQNRYFKDMKDSAAITEILAGKAGTIEATEAQHPEIVQYYCTDWDFIVSRADMNGKLVFVENGKVSWKKPSTSGESVINLVFGSNLREFETEMDARTQIGEVKASSWAYKDQAPLSTNSSSAGSFQEHGNIQGSSMASSAGLQTLELRHSGQVTEPELKAWADATMMRSRLSKIRGRAKIQGFSGVSAGKCVTLAGMGERFNGKAYVTAVRHELGAGTWNTHIQFGLSSELFYQKHAVAEIPAAGLTPSVSGLQIAVVVKLEGDPDGEDRIQVKMPLLDNAAEGTWARIATLDAGNNRGSYFRPEIGDEVIVGFVNDDPRDAIVLGMLNSSNKPAPLPTTDDNHIKGFVTRSEMKVLFDDEKKIITISTPAGNSIVIDEDKKSIKTTDQSGNTWEMSENGIEMKSPKDIKIEATGEISLKATKDIKMEGLNVKAKASAELTMEGTAKASLKASGQAEVKGAMVMIN
jgi:Rhs element Vgr protein